MNGEEYAYSNIPNDLKREDRWCLYKIIDKKYMLLIVYSKTMAKNIK